MINYLYADLRRVLTRIPRLFVLLPVYILLSVIFIIAKNTNGLDSVVFMSTFGQYMDIIPIVVGITELVSIFSSDFKAKTMQVAIGIGIPRRRIVLSKLLEVIIIILIDTLIIGIISVGTGAFLGIELNSEQFMEIFARLLTFWLKICCFIDISMILIFNMQSTGIAIVFYMFCAPGFIRSILKLLLELDFLKPLYLSNALPSSLFETFQTRMVLGNISIGHFIGIAIYIVAAYFITVLTFKKRELDF